MLFFFSELHKECSDLYVSDYELKLGPLVQAARPKLSRENDRAMFDYWKAQEESRDYVAGLILGSFKLSMSDLYHAAHNKRDFMTALSIVWRRYQVIQARRLLPGKTVTMRVPNVIYNGKIERITPDCLVELNNRDCPAHPLWLYPTPD